MKNSKLFLLLILLSACANPNTSSNIEDEDFEFQSVGSIERLDPDLNIFLPQDAKIELIASGFEWSEGPLWLEDQNALIFSDVPTNKIWKWTEKDSLSLFLEPSGYLGTETNKKEPGSNGLALNTSGQLIICQHGERRVARMNASLSDPKPDFIALASTYEGKKFNSPNDLIFNKSGQLFFNDPPYGLDPWNTKELDFQGVYRLDPDGSLNLLLDTLSRPNGIGLSPDESTLYIAQSDPEKARYYAFDLGENGDILGGNILLDATMLIGSENPGLPDGLAVHSSGTLFASGPGGILVISPEGKHLGTIKTGQGTANCAFDSDENYLYMTADAFLMRIMMK
jgi:gluconolactonase